MLQESVIYEENGTDAIGMDYSKLTPLVVEAMRALPEENEVSKRKLGEFSARADRVAESGT